MSPPPNARPNAFAGAVAGHTLFIGLVAVAGGCKSAPRRTPDPVASSIAMRWVKSSPNVADSTERLAAEDPLAFLRKCREHCVKTVRDYRCRFVKREPGITGMTSEERIAVRFRETPFSVDLRWERNPGLAKRVSYVAGRWTDGKKELALIEPAGVFGVLFPKGIKRHIHGIEMRKAARRTIDQFGFKNTLDLMIRHCERAAGDPRYSLQYLGRGEIAGRPTYIFERRLPFIRIDDPNPDRLLVVGIDCEWLVPTACYAYADDQGRSLLGSYVTVDVELNVGLTDADF